MAEIINDRQVFSLLEVTLSLRKTISARYQRSFWVKAEMNKLNYYSYSGHCYPDLLEKSDGKVVAQFRATLWKDDFVRINETFLATLREPLTEGIKILFNAVINFDPVHGLSLRIIDIDPTFSLGELEKEKLATIARLKQEGIFDHNRRLAIPLLPKRIAIISVETSKGYSDFLKVVRSNPWGYRFFCFLFPALLQGERSVDSIVAQLKQIRKVKEHFDVVAIIRGGGGDVGLSSYNSYPLAREIAGFPLPVLTGIGHSTNETVTEMIAFKNAITPTELADFLLQMFHNFAVPLQKAEEVILNQVRKILSDEKLNFFNTTKYFKSVAAHSLSRNLSEVNTLTTKMLHSSSHLIIRTKEQNSRLIKELSKGVADFTYKRRDEILNIERNVTLLDPAQVLKRGYTLTLKNGKAIKSIAEALPNDVITTVVSDGAFNSTVIDSKK